MTVPTIFLQGMNLVLLGDFNPKIFQPAWFVAQNLIGENEAESVEINVISADIVIFTMDWLRLQVSRERFQLSTTQEPYYEMMRDVLIGTFTILEHTPVHSMGVNIDYHYRMPSIEAWHGLGHKLAPKEPWAGILSKPGLTNLTMQGKRDNDYSGNVNVGVAPSVKVRPGVCINVNDHYEVDSPKESLGSNEMLSVLKDIWPTSVQNASSISQKLLEIT